MKVGMAFAQVDLVKSFLLSFLSAFIREIRGWPLPIREIRGWLFWFKRHLTHARACSSVQKSFNMPTYLSHAYATTPFTSSTKN